MQSANAPFLTRPIFRGRQHPATAFAAARPIAGAMLIVMLAIGLMGPRTKGLELEKISK
jgi:hypothetical protein